MRPYYTTPTGKDPDSVMIYGCMTPKVVSRIAAKNLNMNAQKYIKEILVPKLKPSHDLFQENQVFIFQQDSAPFYLATVCKQK